jgi:transcriptional regulator with XRE-family HTH domain
MSPIKNVALKLKNLRQKRSMSQQALADRAGVSRTYIARLETAKHDPTLTVLEKLARALKVKTAELLGDERIGSRRILRSGVGQQLRNRSRCHADRGNQPNPEPRFLRGASLPRRKRPGSE